MFNACDDLPDQVPLPPEAWRGPFEAMATECRISGRLGEAVDILKAFMDRVERE